MGSYSIGHSYRVTLLEALMRIKDTVIQAMFISGTIIMLLLLTIELIKGFGLSV